MNRNLIAGALLAFCLITGAQAQTWTTTTEYRTSVDSMHLTPDVQRRLDEEIRAQELEFGPVFVQERTALQPILTTEQLQIYDEGLSDRNYYAIGLMTPDEYRAWRSGFDSRLNLTPDQRDRYYEITSRTSSNLAPISGRYTTRYTAVLTPDQWNTYRTGVVSSYTMDETAEQGNLYNSMDTSSSVQSTEVVEERRYTETTTQEVAPMQPAPQPVQETRVYRQNWRNQDLK